MFQQLQLLKRMTLACGWLQGFAGRRFLLLCGEKQAPNQPWVSTKSAMGYLQIVVAVATRPKVVIRKNFFLETKKQSCHQEIVEYHQLSIQIQGMF
jgi:hypothetical protein